ncbi:DUF397 domain-containing protein [Streptomyces sp. S07_1.15]|uniref:DUF397 domain-containing protein n=1 Tax=Streptomyces sp. S07_1.15 TaxID=2873925 RepID=UPI001D15398B|nr:DUF397 domain-containing protein [Streptomyces sp. S07_1.15]MCC3651552.1 DUF397 domain-containing protein [Streptomyces sp. S07_1.15]
MPEPVWVKSSYSEASGNACIEVAVSGGDTVAIRDSVFPARSFTTSRAALGALVASMRTRTLDDQHH